MMSPTCSFPASHCIYLCKEEEEREREREAVKSVCAVLEGDDALTLEEGGENSPVTGNGRNSETLSQDVAQWQGPGLPAEPFLGLSK